MYEPTAEWLLVVFSSVQPLAGFSLSFYLQVFFSDLAQQCSSPHFSLWTREAQTILSFSLSCLSCFSRLMRTLWGMYVRWLQQHFWLGVVGGENVKHVRRETLSGCLVRRFWRGVKGEGRWHVEARGAAAAWEKARRLRCKQGERRRWRRRYAGWSLKKPCVFQQAQIITSLQGTRALLRGEPPKREPSLGAIFRKKVTWEKNNGRWEYKDEGEDGG